MMPKIETISFLATGKIPETIFIWNKLSKQEKSHLTKAIARRIQREESFKVKINNEPVELSLTNKGSLIVKNLSGVK